jgi:hypothetical protein
MTQPRPYETLLPPPPEALAAVYFPPLMTPVPCVTRLPPPPAREELLKRPFIRFEAGGGGMLASNILFDIHIILHSYAPYPQEPAAEQNMQYVLAWGANAQGTTIPHSGIAWYVTFSRPTALITRHTDPLTKIVRYRSMVGWRIVGTPIQLVPPPTPGPVALSGDGSLTATAVPGTTRRVKRDKEPSTVRS